MRSAEGRVEEGRAKLFSVWQEECKPRGGVVVEVMAAHYRRTGLAHHSTSKPAVLLHDLFDNSEISVINFLLLLQGFVDIESGNLLEMWPDIGHVRSDDEDSRVSVHKKLLKVIRSLEK